MAKDKRAGISLIPKLILLLIIVGILGINAVYMINEQEQAVVTTLGAP